jgi:hypothetical protein
MGIWFFMGIWFILRSFGILLVHFYLFSMSYQENLTTLTPFVPMYRL